MKEIQELKQNLRASLEEALSSLKSFQECALLSYPDHYNIGDHLIWLGEILYLTDVLGIRPEYCASVASFSDREMEEKLDRKQPILIHGGGNLGDLWGYYQNFYEKIISQYPDRPIVILSQSLIFRYESKLNRAREIFNNHPDLTLIARENQSYRLALQYFPKCKVFKAPDLALQLIDLPSLSLPPDRSDTILYLRRQDQELNTASSPDILDLPNLVVEDWSSYQNKGKPALNSIGGLTVLFQEGWREGSLLPREWVSRQLWKQFHPYTAKFKNLDNSSLHLTSWNYAHNGIYQFSPHRLVITSRLHGHILCIILGIPHVFLANAYHKNESFYETWSHGIPFCKFARDPSEVKEATRKLLSLSPA
ncbi:polysaccharide pyruvyl transferase family protein [Pannus brasiliensis CCIBt3594]|uniref:Polysaccharide pyruvyl transferase family protein n=1 Tax=Pannus brasiliensis CCIBt3594 TaxID=1427578 RepID=A0AAW9QRS7_9CHRO